MPPAFQTFGKDFDMDMKTVGYLAKVARKRLDLSQREVAEILHTSPQNISNFENGLNNNAVFLLWYLENGLLEIISDYKEGVKIGKL